MSLFAEPSGEAVAELRAARAAAALALTEDLAGYGDLTGRVFEGEGQGSVVARTAGVLSGTQPFVAAAAQVDERLRVAFEFRDGDPFGAGDTLGTISGPLPGILMVERTGLNFLGRLSGIASLTAAFVAETAGTAARIAATRKTTPGLRFLEKRAVEHGGGLSHRFGLFDAVMIKDNHIRAAGGVREAVLAVRARLGHMHLIEVEVESIAQLDEALECGVPVVLLDNMDLDGARAAVNRVAGCATVEVSGGITLERVRPLAETGVDVISVGSLTTRAAWIDIALDME